MSPLYANRKAQASIRDELALPHSNTVDVALRYALDSLVRQENKILSTLHAGYTTYPSPLSPIRSPMREISTTPRFKPLPHWSFDPSIEHSCRQAARIQLDLQDLLQTTTIDKALIQLIYPHKTLHKALKTLNLETLLLLPQALRKEKSLALKQLLTQSLSR